MDVTRFLDSITHDRHYRDQIARIEEIPAREATYADLDPPLPEPLADVLRAGGI